MIRQEISIEPAGRGFKQDPNRTGLSLFNGNDQSKIIFNAATANEVAIFLGGKGTEGPAIFSYTSLTFGHELCHFVGWKPGVKSAFDAFVKKSNIKPLTWYAATNPPNELFPEAFALYKLDPTWARRNWPTLYQWFETFMKTGSPPP